MSNIERFEKPISILDIQPRTTEAVEAAIQRAWPIIHDGKYDTIMVSISGGADSDLMLDMIERIGYPKSKVVYVFFNTGMEFHATRNHIKYLEKKYGIEIKEYRASMPVPIAVKKHGYPFLSKRVSDCIHRLQMHNFTWEDGSFEELYAKYPKCKVGLRWWCNAWGEGSQMNIQRNKYLKEFLMENHPPFLISAECCNKAKKNTAHSIEKEINPGLSCIGVRKAEGGQRATAYHSCYTEDWSGVDHFRPLFWFANADKESYEKTFDVCHSECYTKYGLKRTGCACCPYGRDWKYELEVAEKYDKPLYQAAIHVFGQVYDYTRKYYEFREKKQKQGCECEQLTMY